MSGERAWRIFREVSELHHEELDTDMGLPGETPETTTVVCPHCKSEVPTSLYCAACNCPLEIAVPVEDYVKSNELRFDLTPLMEMQAEGESGADETLAGPRYAAVDSTVKGINFNKEPVEKESLINPPSVEVIKPIALETGVQEDGGSLEGTLQTEEPRGPALVIEKLASELLNSVYLGLWSIGLLRKEGTGEEQFLRSFDAHLDRIERCIDQRDHLLESISDLEVFDAKAEEVRVDLDELDVRRSLGDLHDGEYEAKAPALRWTIAHNEAESDRLRGRIAMLENLTSLMPQGKVEEAVRMAEDAVGLIREAEVSARLIPGTAAKVRASVETIRGLLKRPP
jgi:hypothetical protein